MAAFLVTSTADSGPGTLRTAINQVNADTSDSPSAPDAILFELTPPVGSTLATITLSTPLPPITNPVAIDGYSQAGSSTNSASSLNSAETDIAVINVQVDAPGVSPTATQPGLFTVIAANTTIDGLSITSFQGPAIALLPPPNSPNGSVGDDIWGNFIGVDSFDPSSFNELPVDAATSTASSWTHINALGNSEGILVESSNNRIGGTLPPSRNVIQGNHGNGVDLTTASGTGNLVEGNYILDNDANGISITTSNNLIGEAIGAGPAGGGNIISGNNYGVAIVGPSASGNILVNNEIGTNVGLQNVLPQIRGMTARPNRYDGVLIQDAPGNIVGGQLSNSRNVIAANGRDGISIQNVATQDATGNIVQGNYVGYNLRSGVISILPNRDGISISSAGNTIGGLTAAARNYIASNARNGILISSVSLDMSNLTPVPIPNADPTGNFVAGNYIGTEGGADDFGNTLDGILIDDANGNTIGGTVSGAQNVISGNNNGVVITNDGAGAFASTGNVIAGNNIGLMSDNTTPLPNAVDGVLVKGAADNTIGGSVAAAANLLSGDNNGLHLSGTGATGNVVEGNYVGTDATGTIAARNAVDGILIDAGASDNTVGGTSSATRNIISGNDIGLTITGVGSTGNVVAGNYIGVAVGGATALPNAVDGVSIASPGNTVGGTVAGAANVISGNFIGIYLTTVNAADNLIEGNLIGTDATGKNALGNTADGIRLDGGAAGNTIGGTAIVDSNLIAFNDANGVNVVSGAANSILSNQIDSNGALGIAVATPSPLLTAIALTAVESDGTTATVIQGSVTSTVGGTFVLQFFSNPLNGSNTYAYEGQTLIATETLVLSGGGVTPFTYTLPTALNSNQVVTFTVTSPDAATSAFSTGMPVATAAKPQIFTVTNTNDSGPGSLRAAVAQVDQAPSLLPGVSDQIVFDIPGAGQQTISLLSPLFITNPVNIEGFTQPGSSANSIGVGFNGVINIRLDGHNAVPNAGQSSTYPVQGLLTFAAINCEVSGLSLTGYMNGPAILLAPAPGSGATGDTITDNLIGEATLVSTVDTVAPSSNPLGNLVGIEVQSSRNSIGGTSNGAGDIIEGNNGPGLKLDGPSGTGNVVDGNAIVNNLTDGVLINSANNLIGEEIASATNLISGNGGNGVHIQGTAAEGNVVGYNGGANVLVVSSSSSGIVNNFGNGVLIEDAPGNIIETNSITGNVGDGVRVMNNTTTDAINNSILNNQIVSNLDGVNISSADNIVSQLNGILTNRRNGITISSTDLDADNNNLGALPNAQPIGNVISGNLIGTFEGNADNGNTLDGVLINLAGNNTIGGLNSALLNTISGNNEGVVIRGATSVGNVVAGNDIGTKGGGNAPLPNAVDGVLIQDAGNNTIGGTAPLSGNVISGNNIGVHLTGVGATGNVIEGNDIGTGSLGSGAVRNATDGVLFDGNASNNTLGGLASGAGNTIGYNVGSGVVVASGTGDTILSNSIFSNDRIGIDLVAPGDPANGVTPNQTAPAAGPNDLVNYPTLGYAASDGLLKLGIQGTFVGAEGQTYLLQFFSSTTADPSGYGQGQTYLGSAEVTPAGTNPNQFATVPFAAILPVGLTVGEYVTATATVVNSSGSPAYGSTSEFSKAIPTVAVQVGFSAPTYTVNQTAGTATITVTRSGGTGANQGTVTVDYSVGGGTAVAGTNYTAVPNGTLTFAPGVNSQTITIPLINDNAVASSTTLNITLSNPTGGATITGTNPVSLTIANTNVPQVAFSIGNYSVNESAGTATIVVIRNTGQGTATVNYATSNDTAVTGADYTAASGTLHFAAGQTSQSFIVPIRDAYKVGGVSIANLTLSSPSGASLGPPSTATLSIVDNDSAGALQFNNVTYGVSATANSALITVTRTGGVGGAVTVHYATGGGSAVAGQDYTPQSGTLTFAPGQASQTFSVPILNHQLTGAVTVGLKLTAPTSGATLGAVSQALLSIAQNAVATPVRAGNTPGPEITNFQLQTNGHAITGVTLSFNEALDAARAQNLENYGYYILAAGADNAFGTGDDYSVAIASAAYNAATFQVLITPVVPLPLGQIFSIGINTQASVPLQRGLTDAAGNLLDGAYNGHSGTPYQTVFGLGTQLQYFDGSGNHVSLQLNRGGLMALQLAGNGNAEQLQIVGPVPGKSTLTGAVHGVTRHAATTIPVITGSAGVRIRLPRSQFHIGQLSAAAVDAVLARHRGK